MDLQKRDCGIKMRLNPYGSGWTDFYADFGDGERMYVIDNTYGDNFETFIQALCWLHPETTVDDRFCDEKEGFEIKYGICEEVDGEYVVDRVVDDVRDEEMPLVCSEIAWKASFSWINHMDSVTWQLERPETEDKDFLVKVIIQESLFRRDDVCLEYTVAFKDLCYAVAKTMTEVLKEHGIYGYHKATYDCDINLRHLLALKAIALDCFEAITPIESDKEGERTDFTKEMELLLFDM